MLSSRVLLFCLLLLLPVPLASAERVCTPGLISPLVSCAEHTPEGVGTCDGTADDHYTSRVDIYPQFFWIGAGIEWLCESTSDRSAEASLVFITVYSPEFIEAGVRWEASHVTTSEGTAERCSVLVHFNGGGAKLGCPAGQGPPNPSRLP